MGVTSKDNGYDALVKRVIGMRGAVSIATGILAKDGEKAKAGVDAEGEALTLIQVAVWNEFGTSDGHVPARSFIRAWFDEEEPKLREKLTVLLRQVVAGQLSSEQAFEQMGQYCVGQIQLRIAAGIDPENAKSTVDRKHSSVPLIGATGQLRAGVSYEVREGGSGGGSE